MKTYLVTIIIKGAFHPTARKTIVAESLAEAINQANQLIKEKNWNAHIRAVYERVWLGEEYEL